MKEVQENDGNLVMIDTARVVAIRDAHPIENHVEIIFDGGAVIVLNIRYNVAFEKIFGC